MITYEQYLKEVKKAVKYANKHNPEWKLTIEKILETQPFHSFQETIITPKFK